MTYVTLTDEELCELTDPSQPEEVRGPAREEVKRRITAYLNELDPSCFEGDVESGPYIPKAPIEWTESEVHSRNLHDRVNRELRDRQERFPQAFSKPGMMLMDICFRIASDDPYHPSPSWVRQYAGQIGLCGMLQRHSIEEAAYSYRMSSESYRRSLEGLYVEPEDRVRIHAALAYYRERAAWLASAGAGDAPREFDRLIERFKEDR